MPFALTPPCVVLLANMNIDLRNVHTKTVETIPLLWYNIGTVKESKTHDREEKKNEKI